MLMTPTPSLVYVSEPGPLLPKAHIITMIANELS